MSQPRPLFLPGPCPHASALDPAPRIASATPRRSSARRQRGAPPLRPAALGDALLLGIVGDALLRVSSGAPQHDRLVRRVRRAVSRSARRRHDSIPLDARWLIAPTLAIAALFTWRASESLAAYNILAAVGTLALLASAMQVRPGRDDPREPAARCRSSAWSALVSEHC